MSEDQNRISILIREFLKNPDSPLGLQIQSQFNAIFAPRDAICEQIVQSIMRFEIDPSDDNKHQMLLAVEAWETMNGPDDRNPIPDDVLFGFEKEAKERLENNKTKPPSIESILDDLPSFTDYEYEIAHTLGGIKGIWHRLWSSISTQHSWSTLGFPGQETYDELVLTLREELEQALSRPLSDTEWLNLTAAAHWHSNNVGIPFFKKMK